MLLRIWNFSAVSAPGVYPEESGAVLNWAVCFSKSTLVAVPARISATQALATRDFPFTIAKL